MRRVFFDLRDFRTFLSILLSIVRLVTQHPDERRSSCSSSNITTGFWLIRRPKFLEKKSSLEHLLYFFFTFSCVTSFKSCYKWTYHSKRNIQVAWDISIRFSILPKLNNQCCFLITQFFISCHHQNLLVRQAIAESSG